MKFKRGKGFSGKLSRGLYLCFVVFLFLNCGLNNFVSAEPLRVDPLLKTSWKQRDMYAVFTPENERLGCWSVAFAQILFYHGLVPTGATSYTGTYYSVEADFENPSVDLQYVVSRITPETSAIQAEHTARYLWYAAAASGKDFGTTRYTGNSDVRRDRIAEYYGISSRRVRRTSHGEEGVIEFIRDELKEGRPLLLHVDGETGDGGSTAHALVIDGCRGENQNFEVHLNFGWEGVGDGWYSFFEPYDTEYGNYNDYERWVLRIHPPK
jgi:hypothetical protein